MSAPAIADAHVQEYRNLRVASLNREFHERTCGYWFTVTSGATAHTAFKTRADLDTWLSERGLTLAPLGWRFVDGMHVECPLQDAGTASNVEIVGSYYKASHRNRETFDAIAPILETSIMDNAEMTPAKITEDEGVRTIHYMNVNYRERKPWWTR